MEYHKLISSVTILFAKILKILAYAEIKIWLVSKFPYIKIITASHII